MAGVERHRLAAKVEARVDMARQAWKGRDRLAAASHGVAGHNTFFLMR